ncbi:MAG TPA: ribonuclease Y, partial [Patescibacteria group bacterium]
LQKTSEDLDTKHKTLLLEAKDEALKIKEKAVKEYEQKEKYLKELEEKIRTRESSLDKRAEQLDSDKQRLTSQEQVLRTTQNELDELKKQQVGQLEKVAKLTMEKAREQLLASAEKEYAPDILNQLKKQREALKEDADKEARKIIATAINRLATDQIAESTVSAVALPNEEMKGRIIGKEGRNVQAFEKATGVDVIIDETPDSVGLTSFDPVRRAVAKMALEMLVSDGRIHPTRIEETVTKAKSEINNQIKEAGEAAVEEVGLPALPTDLVKILGRLKFRTSYGQNVLKHSVEVAHIATLLGQEIGANIDVLKRAGLLHDIGKAMSQETPGGHLQLSVDICRKYGLSDEVIHAVEAHHEDIEAETVEAIIIKAADAMSGARPGARRESLESYVKRLTELENIANSFKGVDKSFAIQAGREIRIIVKPEDVDDLGAFKMARDIAKKIEDNLQYPGTIRVNVIRETRASEVAK